MTVQITVNGKRAITTAQAAERYGLTPDAMRHAIKRLVDADVIQPIRTDEVDTRVPLYLAAEMDRAMGARPGKGRRAQR